MYSNFLAIGKNKEREFAESLAKIGLNDFQHSTETQDIKEHWDIELKVKFDVKSLKKVRRHDDQVNEHFHYLEVKNVQGLLGWLYSETVNFFAFELQKYWIIVSKEDLQSFVKNNVEKIYTPTPELYKLYTRKDRKDVITLVTSYDLCYIAAQI